MAGKMTLLEMVQSILSDTDSDEISSIGDTVEGEKIASIIRDVYYELTSVKDVPELMKIVQFEGLSDSSYPNYLHKPENVTNIKWLQYNVGTTLDNTDLVFRALTYLSPEDFTQRISKRVYDANSMTLVYEFTSGSPLAIINNAAPSYYTSFDDEYYLTDSWNSVVEDTLQALKTRAFAKWTPTFSMTDDFTPLADTNMFPLLLSEAKSRAFSVMKGYVDVKIEEGARRQRLFLQGNKYSMPRDPTMFLPRYGR